MIDTSAQRPNSNLWQAIQREAGGNAVSPSRSDHGTDHSRLVDRSAQSETDRFELSPEAERRLRENELDPSEIQHQARLYGNSDEESERETDSETDSDSKDSHARTDGSGEPLSEDQEREVDELEQRDRDVRTHEQAHVAAGGPYVQGGIQYEYQTGPDDKRYAVGGHVNIDSSPIPDDPEATIQKAQIIRQAAMAPADPSPQDLKVATKAAQMLAEAQREAADKRTEEAQGPNRSDRDEPAAKNSRESDRVPSDDSSAGSPNPLFSIYDAAFSQQAGSLLNAVS